MIITRNWLNEWMDISSFTSEKICETLNAIGLEVDSLTKIRIPKKVIVGFVKECIPHPNADKLSICQVDIGDTLTQIVCGANNVKAGQFVPVAIIGCVLNDNFKIKKAKLRGVESNGMICSSKEIGLPELNDGILELDESIGELIIGKELCEYSELNDDIIDIELTANRGDCLSVFGVARDLSAALEQELHYIEDIKDEEGSLGIGRILSLKVENGCSSSLLYKIFIKDTLKKPLLLELRLSFVNKKVNNIYDIYKTYTTHSTGVIVKLYSCDKIINEENKKCEIILQKDKNSAELIKIRDKISYIGLDENKELKPDEDDKTIIFEESYINPFELSKVGKFIDSKSDATFYHCSRGSEPNLQFGSKFFKTILNKYSKVQWYNGSEAIDNLPEEAIVNVYQNKINNLVGMDIDKNNIIKILKNLDFTINVKDESDLISVKIPLHRHDIVNEQDITEEIVRMVGIDNIKSKPLDFVESNNHNEALNNYNKRLYLRKKASSNGFFEIVNYIFTDSKKVELLNLQSIENLKELVNPVTNELNTLRSSLLIGLLETASRNIKYGKKSIRLFEMGSIFDLNRKESFAFSFLFSGETQRASIRNNGKPDIIDFFNFSQKISSIIGKFEIQKSQNEKSFLSPYESGDIIKNGKIIGNIGRLHLDIENDYALPATYFCEIDFDKLVFADVVVKEYSKYPSTERDFSFLVPKNIAYKDIKNIISELKSKEIIGFYPIDIYENKEFNDNVSLTIRFIMQSSEKTLNDEDITKYSTIILDGLKKKGIVLR